MENSVALLSTVPFKTLDKWYVELYLNKSTINSHYTMLPLKKLIKPVKRRIKKNDYDGVLPIVSKIVFKTGEIIFRKENKTGMDLLYAKKGDLIVSSINFHQGAVAYNSIGDFVCSTHYQTYLIEDTLVVPEYLVLVLRSEKFISSVSGIKAKGIKNESGYDFIGEFKIPVPSSLIEQKKLLDDYHTIITNAENIENDVKKLENSIDTYLFSTFNLRKRKPSKENHTLLQELKLSNAERWDVDFALNQSELSFLDDCNCDLKAAKTFILSTQYGLSEKANRDSTGVPMIRMGNIKNSDLCLNDMKYLPRSKKLNGRYLDKGDLLFNRTNSKELVGKTAIFDLDDEYVFASYIIRVKLDLSKVDVKYINYLFASRIIREQIDLVSRQVLGQVNINVDELNNLLFPMPPLKSLDREKITQEKIAAEIDKIKNKEKSLLLSAAELRQRAMDEFEVIVFN